MLPFKEITPDHMNAVRALTAGSALSYHQFTNMFMWRHVMNARICLKEGALYVYNQYRTYPPSLFFPFCEKGREEECVREMIAMTSVRRFRPVTEAQARVLLDMFPRSTVKSLRSQWDYCYAAQDLIELPGRRYHGKKNHLNAFLAAYDWKWHDVDAGSDESVLSLLRAASMRLDEQDGSRDKIEEHEANLELIDHVREFGLRCGVITVGEIPVAYSVGEQISDTTALIHIEKADRDYRGAYAAINQMLVSNAFSHLTLINREEDMGIEGLRRAKESYRPIRMNEVFEVVLEE